MGQQTKVSYAFGGVSMLQRWLAFCLLLVAPLGTAYSQELHITLVGVHKQSGCAEQLAALQEELKELQYPDGWQIYVACTGIAWDVLWRKAGGPPTDTAFSSLTGHYTVLNGAIFSGLRNEYRRTVAHELGHIVCGCKDESTANARADAMLTPHRSRERVLVYARSGPVEDEPRLPVWVAELH